MATMSQTTGTGNSPRKERKVANGLFIAIAAVVVLAFLYFAFASRMNERTGPHSAVPEQNRPVETTNPPTAPPTQ